MVQINLSFPFIFAVAAIAPVVALPVSDIGLSRPIDEPQTLVFMTICYMIYVTNNP